MYGYGAILYGAVRDMMNPAASQPTPPIDISLEMSDGELAKIAAELAGPKPKSVRNIAIEHLEQYETLSSSLMGQIDDAQAQIDHFVELRTQLEISLGAAIAAKEAINQALNAREAPVAASIGLDTQGDETTCEPASEQRSEQEQDKPALADARGPVYGGNEKQETDESKTVRPKTRPR